MVELTLKLDKAAYYILKGARLRGFVGPSWNTCKVQVVIEEADLETIRREAKHIIDYTEYMSMRVKLKIKMRKAYKNILGGNRATRLKP